MSQGNVAGKCHRETRFANRGLLQGQRPQNTFYTYQNNEIYSNGNSNAVGGSSLTNVTYQ
jgi:hypothetical protein